MKKKILFVLCLLAGLIFINAGLDKFFHYMPMPKNLPEKMIKVGAAFTEIGWILPLVGFAEVLGGILLIFNRTRALGVIVLIPILVGIILTTIIIAPANLPMILVLTLIIIWAMIDNWGKYLPLIAKRTI